MDEINKETLFAEVNKKLDRLMDYSIEQFGQIDSRLLRLEEQMATKADKDQIMEILDRIALEMKTYREEQAVHAQRHDDIEERVNKVESIPSIAHQIKK